MNNCGEAFYKPPIIPSETKKFSDIFDTLGDRPIFQNSNLFRIRLDAFFRDDMSKVGHLLLKEFTLGRFQLKVVGVKSLKNCLKTVKMSLESVRKDDDVIKVYKAVSQVDISHGSFH